jgi:alkylation response protein AidB-like acyl-CoA dehydrogenase
VDYRIMDKVSGRASESRNAARYLQAARDLVPLIEAEAEQMHVERKVSPKIVAAFQDAELFWMAAPEALGGGGLRVAEAMRVVETVAAADGSTGWCLMALNGSVMIQSGFLPAAGASLLYGGKHKQVTAGNAGALGRARVVDGGIRVTGRWPFGSGSQFADYIGGGVMMVDDDGAPLTTADGSPDTRFAFAPTDQVTLEGGWDSFGLVGTSSQNYSMTDVFVPDELIQSTAAPTAVRDESNYKVGVWALSSAGHNALALGLARSALQEVARLTENKKRMGYPVPVGEYPVFQAEFAKHDAEYQAARAYALGIMETAQDFAEHEGQLTPELNSRVLQSAVWSTKAAERVVRFAHLWSGSQSFQRGSRMGRIFLDMAVATQHVQVDDIGFVGNAPTLLASWTAADAE